VWQIWEVREFPIGGISGNGRRSSKGEIELGLYMKRNGGECISGSGDRIKSDGGRKIIVQERGFNDQVIIMAMKAGGVEFTGLGIGRGEGPVFMVCDKVMQHYFWGNAESKKQDHRSGEQISCEALPHGYKYRLSPSLPQNLRSD
jgi:hypothetical protein